MTANLSDLTSALLDAARKAGAESADAIAASGTAVAISLRNRALEQAERSEGTEIGLRVLIGGRQACVSASDISEATIRALAERGVAMALEAPVDPHAGLADPGQLARSWDLDALDLTDAAVEPGAATLEEAARRVEAAALAAEGITQVEATAAYSLRSMHLPGVTAAVQPRFLRWPSPAKAPGCSVITPASIAPMQPTCPPPRPSASLLPRAP